MLARYTERCIEVRFYQFGFPVHPAYACGTSAVLSTAAAVFFFQVKNRTSGTVYAIVEQDSKELMRLPLSEPGEYRISDGDSYNVIEITEGGVRMKEADCPDQICVSRGLIQKSGQSIVCLPHRLVIRLEQLGDQELDAVVE